MNLISVRGLLGGAGRGGYSLKDQGIGASAEVGALYADHRLVIARSLVSTILIRMVVGYVNSMVRVPGVSFLNENCMPIAALRVGGPKSPRMCRKVPKCECPGHHFGAPWGSAGCARGALDDLGLLWTSTCSLQAVFFFNFEGRS